MKNQNSKRKKGTVLLLIASIGFLMATFWLMQTQIKPRNIGNIEYTMMKLARQEENNLYYIDRAAGYSLQEALEVKSRTYQSGFTTKQVCNLQLDICKEGKPDCETNLRMFCENEVEKGFRANFAKYLQTLNTETGSKLGIDDYQIKAKAVTSETTNKIREIEVIGIATKKLQAAEGDIEYSIKPNFKVRTRI